MNALQTLQQLCYTTSTTSTDIVTDTHVSSIGNWLYGTNMAPDWGTSATNAGFWLTVGGQHLIVQAPVQAAAAAPRNFNCYINASDLLEEFITWLGETQGVKQHEVMGLPLELFIKWLIIRACEEDGEEPNVEMPVTPLCHTRRKRCKYCGRYMANDVDIPLHEECSAKYFQRGQLKSIA